MVSEAEKASIRRFVSLANGAEDKPMTRRVHDLIAATLPEELRATWREVYESNADEKY